jgi:hypothetical protein
MPWPDTPEHRRLADCAARRADWKHRGPNVAGRARGTIREDYSPDGDARASFPHDPARSRADRWNEDGLAWTTPIGPARPCRNAMATLASSQGRLAAGRDRHREERSTLASIGPSRGRTPLGAARGLSRWTRLFRTSCRRLPFRSTGGEIKRGHPNFPPARAQALDVARAKLVDDRLARIAEDLLVTPPVSIMPRPVVVVLG